MLEIRNVKVFGLKESIIRSGLPMGINFDDFDNDLNSKEILDENHIRRGYKLANTKIGSGHDNFLCGIIVQFDLKYPEYISSELQRYHFLDIISSMSKMHRLCKMDIKNCVNKYVDKEIIHILENYIDQYNINSTYENFMRVISNCPMGLEKWMSITTNYRQLKTIYHQRKNHKLKEDWGEFCRMIENLPMSDLIIKEI